MKRSVFISGGNQCTHSKQPTCHKSLTYELYPIKFYRVHLAMRGFKIHNFNGNWQFHIYIYADPTIMCESLICSYKSPY